MDIKAKKSLGQNFLKDENILKKISNSVETYENDVILEIGPGKGALTKYLLQKEGMYLGYEIDERMKPILEKLTNKIIYQDFLKSDISKDLTLYSYEKIYVIANIPYYITTPIIEHLIQSDIHFSKIVLLVQKEVANRFCALPRSKDYGYFTVYLNHYFQVTKLFDVSKFCFDPVPNVDSSVVCFERKNSTFQEEAYFGFLKNCFSNKRKTLKNNLKQYDLERLSLFLESHGYPASVRAEEIEPEVFLELYKILKP